MVGPHHPVINPLKPEKVRRGCNAAAKYKGESLNDKLLTGPDLLQSLLGIFSRFREHQIALTADMGAIFLQAKVPPQECRVSRFLWRSRPEDKVGFSEYTRHVFGAKSSPTCANYALLQAGIHNEEGQQIAAKAIKRNFYMDNFSKPVATLEKTSQVYKNVRTTLKLGRFNFLKWSSHDELVTGNIPEGDRSEAKNKTVEAEPHTSSLPGLQWNVDDDTLKGCRGADKENPNKITQQVVLSFVKWVFNPLGLFAPFTMGMRILLKIIWAKCGQHWDDKIENGDKHKFLDWVRELAELKYIPLKRCSFDKSYKKIDLHSFSDGSLETICTVAHPRAEDEDGVQLSFVIGKCRIGPGKQQSIPQFELQAALYSVRLR